MNADSLMVDAGSMGQRGKLIQKKQVLSGAFLGNKECFNKLVNTMENWRLIPLGGSGKWYITLSDTLNSMIHL